MPNILYLLACLLIAGCGSLPYRPAQFMEPDAHFPGLAELAARPGGVDVLLVHGMCTHRADWADATVARLASALGTQATREAAPPPTPAGVQVMAWRAALQGGGVVRFRALLWSPMTATLKQQLDYDASAHLPVRRASLNAALKDKLIDDCLPDALIYQGVSRNSMQRDMRDAIIAATGEGTAPLVVVSSSLGSKILYDTLWQMLNSPAPAAAQRTLDRFVLLAMAANQLPLLSLADQQSDALTAAPPVDSLQALLLHRRTLASPLTIVAYSDPNDLLSYTLQRERYAAPVFNVLVSNAPTYFGALEMPDAAHLRYLENPDVLRLLACGQPRFPGCP